MQIGVRLKDNKGAGVTEIILVMVILVIFILAFRQEIIELAVWFCRNLSV